MEMDCAGSIGNSKSGINFFLQLEDNTKDTKRYYQILHIPVVFNSDGLCECLFIFSKTTVVIHKFARNRLGMTTSISENKLNFYNKLVSLLRMGLVLLSRHLQKIESILVEIKVILIVASVVLSEIKNLSGSYDNLIVPLKRSP